MSNLNICAIVYLPLRKKGVFYMKKELREKIIALSTLSSQELLNLPNVLITGIDEENSIRTFFKHWGVIPACEKGRVTFPYSFTIVCTDAGACAIPMHDENTLKTKYLNNENSKISSIPYKEFQKWAIEEFNKKGGKKS